MRTLKNNYQKPLVRCSQLHRVMGYPEKTKLPAGAITYAEELFMQLELGWEDPLVNNALLKGNLCQADSAELIKQVIGGPFRAINETEFKNEYLTGVPDVVSPLEDIKNSESLPSFFKMTDLPRSNYWQMQGYCLLTGNKTGKIVYTLNPDPEQIVFAKKNRLLYHFGGDFNNPDFIDICEKIDKQSEIIENMPKHKRLKVFTVENTDEINELIKRRVSLFQDYYMQILDKW